MTLFNVGVGAKEGKARFTSDLDAMNHALAPGETCDTAVEVPVTTLDAIASTGAPTFIKIDVEGLETSVLAGGARTLGSDAVRCVLIEMNGSGRRFGTTDAEIHGQMRGFGFVPARYDALTRSIAALPTDSWNRTVGNTLYVRDVEECRARVRSAPRFRLVNREI